MFELPSGHAELGSSPRTPSASAAKTRRARASKGDRTRVPPEYVDEVEDMRATFRWHDARPGEWSRGTKTIFNPTVAVTMAGLLPDVQPDHYEYDTYNKYSYKPFVDLEERQIFDLQQEEQFTTPEKDVFLYNDRENQAIPNDTTHLLTFDAHNGRAKKSPCAIDTTKEPYVDVTILTLGSASAKDVFEKDLRFSNRDYLDIRQNARRRFLGLKVFPEGHKMTRADRETLSSTYPSMLDKGTWKEQASLTPDGVRLVNKTMQDIAATDGRRLASASLHQSLVRFDYAEATNYLLADICKNERREEKRRGKQSADEEDEVVEQGDEESVSSSEGSGSRRRDSDDSEAAGKGEGASGRAPRRAPVSRPRKTKSGRAEVEVAEGAARHRDLDLSSKEFTTNNHRPYKASDMAKLFIGQPRIKTRAGEETYGTLRRRAVKDIKVGIM